MESGIQPMLTCRDFADFIADYFAGELPPGVNDTFDYHLRLCVNCRRYLSGYAATVTLGKRAFDNDDARVPPEVPDELVHAILAARARA